MSTLPSRGGQRRVPPDTPKPQAIVVRGKHLLLSPSLTRTLSLVAIAALATLAPSASAQTRVTTNKYDPRSFGRVGVLAFTVSPGWVGESPEILADIYATEILGLGYRVIERNQLRRLLEEHNLQTTGIIDEATAVQVGRILGLQGVVIGNASMESGVGFTPTYVFPGGTIIGGGPQTWVRKTYTVKLVDVETGEVIWSAYGVNVPARKVMKQVKKVLRRQARGGR